MKTSKFFFSTLIAAAAMTATAYAETYTVTGNVTGNANGNCVLGGDSVSNVSLTSDDLVVFNAASGHLHGYQGGSFVANMLLGENATNGDYAGYALAIYRGAGSATQTFSGDVSGAGDLGFFKAEANTTNYIFTGNVTALTGDIHAKTQYGNGGLQFGNGSAYSAIATDGVISNISGTGAIITSNKLVYSYAQSDSYVALSIDNSSISAGSLTFRGGANYVVNSDVTVSGALSVAAGTVTFGQNASLALVGMTASSVAGLDETQTGIQSGGVVYAIATGSGTISGLTTANVTVNGSAITSIAGDCRSVVGEEMVSIYNVGVNETVSYSNISSEDLAQTSLINVAGTLDMGTSSSGGVVNVFSGGGKVVWTNTNASHGTTINLGNSFTGTLQLSGNITSGSSLSLGGAEKLILDGVWFWGGNSLTVAAAVSLTDKKSITDRVADTHYYVDGGGIAYTNTFDASGKIVTIAGGINSFSGTTTIGTLNVSGGGAVEISGTAAIGALNLSGGTTTISGGTVTVENSTQVGGSAKLVLAAGGQRSVFRGNLEVNNGGTVELTGGDATGWGGAADSSIRLITINSGGVLHIKDRNGNQTFSNMALVLNGGTISGETAGDTFDLFNNGTTILAKGGASAENVVTSTISAGLNLRQDDSRVTVEEHGVLAVTGIVGDGSAGNHKLIKAGEGTLRLANANTYTGGTTISAGSVVVTNSNALGTGAVTLNGGDLDLRADVEINELNGVGEEALKSDIVNVSRDEYTLRVRKGDTDAGIVGLTEHNDGSEPQRSYTLSLEKFGTADDKLSLRNYLAAKKVMVAGGTLSWAQEAIDGKLNWGAIEESLFVKSGAQFELVLSDSSKTEDYALYVGRDVNLASGAKIVVDLSNVKAGGEEIVLNIIAANAINFDWTETPEASIVSEGSSLEDFVAVKGNEHLAAYVNQVWSYNEGVLSLTLAIPEPSLFGVLAGLGALALVGTRRRRKKA